VIGTVGVLVQAKQSGILMKIKPVLDDLELYSFFISPALRQEALKLVGE
jgi:predicted nucleic acid-binding protein